MDCRIPREQFIGTETFTGPDGLTYPKVNITSNWNQLCLVAWNTNIDYDDENFNGVSYELTVTIGEGEYTYQELYNSFLDIFHLFKEQVVNNNINNFIDVSSFNLNIDTSIKILIDCDGLKNDINYNYINNNAEIIDFDNSIAIGVSGGKHIILIKQVENGIDKILPFTIPFQTFTSELLSDPINTETKYHTFVDIYDDYIDEFYRAFIHPAFFNMIWLNENFFTTDNKKIISTGQQGYNFHNFDNFITDAGIFSSYGMLMNMMGFLFNYNEYISIPSFYKNDTNKVIQFLAENTVYKTPLYIENKIQGEILYNFYEINTNNVQYYSDHYANLYDFSSPFEYEANEFNIPIGRSFTTIPINNLQGQTTYSTSNLPTGLTLNTSTGVISGIPTSISTRQITITANNDGSIYTFDLTFNIVAEQYVYNSPVNDITPNSQFTITPVNPPTSLFGGELTFNNVLVNGMTFNSSTGVITGNSNNLKKPVIITINMTESLVNTTMTYSQQIFVKSPKYYIYLQENMMIYE